MNKKYIGWIVTNVIFGLLLVAGATTMPGLVPVFTVYNLLLTSLMVLAAGLTMIASVSKEPDLQIALMKEISPIPNWANRVINVVILGALMYVGWNANFIMYMIQAVTMEIYWFYLQNIIDFRKEHAELVLSRLQQMVNEIKSKQAKTQESENEDAPPK